MMKIFVILCLMAGAIFSSCVEKNPLLGISEERMELVKYIPAEYDSFWNKDLIDEIEIIPIESDSVLFGPSRGFTFIGDNYFFIDLLSTSNIIRCDTSGRILNSIGIRGRGPNEYLEINDYFLTEDEIIIYSAINSSQYTYNKDGTLLNKSTLGFNFHKIHPIENGYWVYMGQGRENNSYPRLLLYDEQGNIEKSMLNFASCVPFVEDTPVFTQFNDNIYFRETFNNDIYKVTEEGLEVAFRFDFGKYNIPSKFYETKDMMQAGGLLMENDFAVIHRFFESEKYFFIDVFVQKQDDRSVVIYGLKNKIDGSWKWVEHDSEDDKDIFFDSIMFMDGRSNLYAIIEPFKLLRGNYKPGMFKNPNIINSIHENDNKYICGRSKFSIFF